ncbi:MAG: hypothetical protein FJ095_11960 [Deltaproteobacteria bacterium]|nr:hypothetical protein [Deltaproteobacteria bacterium]
MALAAVEASETFVDQSIFDIVQSKLDVIGCLATSESRLLERYAPRDFVAHYQGSDLTFVSRLLEHVGVSYSFEHHGSETRMVFSDRANGFAPSSSIRSATTRPRRARTSSRSSRCDASPSDAATRSTTRTSRFQGSTSQRSTRYRTGSSQRRRARSCGPRSRGAGR